MVLEEPAQMEVGEAVAVTLRPEPTVTVADAIPEQPLPLDPVTE
jgi:hypothetical protein